MDPDPADDAEHESSEDPHWQAAEGNGEAAPSYACPHCGQLVEAEPEALAPFIRCPHCGGEFALPTEVTDEDREAMQASLDRLQSREGELDTLRIKQLAAIRRSYIRSRSHIIVAMILCITTGGELVFAAVRRVWAMHRLDLKSIGFILFAVAAAMAAIYFLRRAMAMTRELDRPRNDNPTTPPDFSTLSSGRDWDKDLRQVQGDAAEH